MNRELKFRAWDDFHKCWVDYFCLDVVKNEVLNEYDDFIIEQYTGVDDINGKEIYEGDKIFAENYENKKVIEGVVGFSHGEYIIYNEKTSVSLVWEELSEVKKIGNIHENPELLEK